MKNKLETAGLSQRQLITLFILKHLLEGPNNPKTLYQSMSETLHHKSHSFSYFYKVANQLAANGDLVASKEGNSTYYRITSQGRDLYSWFQQNFKEQVSEVKKVIDRFVFELSRNGTNPPVEKQLSEEHRLYFSKLVSVKDLCRYVALKMALKRENIHIAGVDQYSKMKFGWSGSEGYLYDLAKEMEKEGILTGRWESEARTIRHLRITEQGKDFFKTIEGSAAERVKQVQHYLSTILNFM